MDRDPETQTVTPEIVDATTAEAPSPEPP
ncbi:MAG: hypothetical protein QOE25_84, partial [Actinomycetota bacterium]|nr:hypothetical protein [Actinomycetota bacterium]